MRKALIIKVVIGLALIAALLGGAWSWYSGAIQPMPGGEPVMVRYEKDMKLADILHDLKNKGVVRNPKGLRMFGWLNKKPTLFNSGTYEFKPGMTAEEIFKSLDEPIRQMVRIPEYYWIKRTAELLEEKGVVDAEEYIALANSPDEFKDVVSFPLPEDSLEGYLFPDTYDLPPLLGAREVIIRQLKTFEKKVWKGLGEPKDLDRALIVASMVELEAAKDDERPVIAGVIENRLEMNMKLQIDATVNYGLQVWRPLTRADYQEVESDYNTYLIDGLPPGPICSPRLKSIEAALNPEKHDYLFYVAMPDLYHLFATNYNDHLKNIRKRRKALAEEVS